MDNNLSNLSPVGAFFRNKWVRIVLVIDAVVIVALVVAAIVNATKTSVINLNVTPVDATILINGNEYENGSYKFAPGTYEIEISHEGMATKTFTVELGDDAIVNMTTYLVGEDGGFEFYELRENYGSFEKLAEMATAGNNVTTDQDASAEGFVGRFLGDYELFTSGVLPIKYTEHEETDGWPLLTKYVVIQRGEDEDCAETLCIRALMLYTDDKEFVNTLLVEKGFKLEDYEVIYEIY